MRIKFSAIPQKFIEEYELSKASQNGWIYFKILCGCYGLPQSGRLANDLLCTRLEKAGYYEAATTPGFCIHKWRPVQSVLLVDDFGICGQIARLTSPEDSRTKLRDYHRLGRNEICRNRPRLGL